MDGRFFIHYRNGAEGFFSRRTKLARGRAEAMLRESGMARNKSTLVVILSAACALAGHQAAQAGSINLCNGNAGWTASWDSSLDGLVQIIDSDCTQLGAGRVFIEKSATFTQGPSPSGIFPTIAISFIQTIPLNGGPTATRIIIEDEIITNFTGHVWTDFHMDLIDSGDAVFDVAATAVSGGPGPIGFSIAPFTQAAFANGNTRLDIWDGVLLPGQIWNPGGGATNGELHIAVTPHDLSIPGTFPTVFSLKETPTPEPASLMLLAFGAVATLRRRR